MFESMEEVATRLRAASTAFGAAPRPADMNPALGLVDAIGLDPDGGLVDELVALARVKAAAEARSMLAMAELVTRATAWATAGSRSWGESMRAAGDDRPIDAIRADVLVVLILGRDPHPGPDQPAPPPPSDQPPDDPYDHDGPPQPMDGDEGAPGPSTDGLAGMDEPPSPTDDSDSGPSPGTDGMAGMHEPPGPMHEADRAPGADSDGLGDPDETPPWDPSDDLEPPPPPDPFDDHIRPDPADPDAASHGGLVRFARACLAAMATVRPVPPPWVTINEVTRADGTRVGVAETIGHGPTTAAHGTYLLHAGGARPPPTGRYTPARLDDTTTHAA